MMQKKSWRSWLTRCVNVGATAGVVLAILASVSVAQNVGLLPGLSIFGRSVSTEGQPSAITAGTDGYVLRRSGTVLGFGQLTGGAFPVSPGVISPSMLDTAAPVSVLGRSANSSGARADIPCSTDGNILRRSGGALGCGQIDLTNTTAAVTGILGPASGGTGNAFTRFSGPSATEKTFTLPNAAATLKTAGPETLWIPAAALINRTTAGCTPATVETATNRVMLKTLDCNQDTDQFSQIAIAMPNSWDAGSFTVTFFWRHGATSTNFGVVWGAQCLFRADNEAVDTAFGTAATVADTGGVTNNVYISPTTGSISCSGTPADGGLTWFQIFRDADNASDTLAIAASLIGVKITYTSNAHNDS